MVIETDFWSKICFKSLIDCRWNAFLGLNSSIFNFLRHYFQRMNYIHTPDLSYIVSSRSEASSIGPKAELWFFSSFHFGYNIFSSVKNSSGVDITDKTTFWFFVLFESTALAEIMLTLGNNRICKLFPAYITSKREVLVVWIRNFIILVVPRSVLLKFSVYNFNVYILTAPVYNNLQHHIVENFQCIITYTTYMYIFLEEKIKKNIGWQGCRVN